MRFCDNKLCQFHVEAPEGMDRLRHLPNSGDIVEIRRLRIVVQDTNRTLHFCEICANVAALIHGK